MSSDLVADIEACPEILEKIRTRQDYAQNLYAAWCNMRWCSKEVWPVIRQDPDKDYWSASWRGAGGLVAELRGIGEDYMDYYCSGMLGKSTYDADEGDALMDANGYVPEGHVTEEIAADLDRIGWFPVPWPENN